MDLDVSELVEHTKSARESLHKGGRPSAASTEGGGRLRRPPPSVDSLCEGFLVQIWCVRQAPKHQDPLKSIKIKNPLKSIKIH